jgi:hypothetical protein
MPEIFSEERINLHQSIFLFTNITKEIRNEKNEIKKQSLIEQRNVVELGIMELSSKLLYNLNR